MNVLYVSRFTFYLALFDRFKSCNCLNALPERGGLFLAQERFSQNCDTNQYQNQRPGYVETEKSAETEN